MCDIVVVILCVYLIPKIDLQNARELHGFELYGNVVGLVVFWALRTCTWADGFSLFMWAGWTKRGRAGEGHGDRSQNDDILDQAALPWALAGASPEWRSRPPFSEPRAWEERGERGDSVPGTSGTGEGVEGDP